MNRRLFLGTLAAAATAPTALILAKPLPRWVTSEKMRIDLEWFDERKQEYHSKLEYRYGKELEWLKRQSHQTSGEVWGGSPLQKQYWWRQTNTLIVTDEMV